MTALAARPHEEPAAPSTQLVAVADQAPGLVPPEILAAEAHWWKGLVVGIAIGIPVCILLWMGMVAIAVGVMGAGWPVWPAVGMGAVVGVFAGAFLGGWAGVTACAERLDEAELHTPRSPR